MVNIPLIPPCHNHNWFPRLLGNKFLAMNALAFSIAYSSVFLFFGLDFTDSFFIVNSFGHNNDGPLWPLTSLIGEITQSILGDKLIYFRIITRVSYFLAVAIPYVFLVRRPTAASNMFIAAATLVTLNVTASGIYGYSSMTLLFLSLSTTLIIRYFYSQQVQTLVLFGIVSAMAILVRFPNIVIVPISMCLIVANIYIDRYGQHKSHASFRAYFFHLSIFLFSLTFVYLLILVLRYGSLTEYYDTFRSYLSVLQHDKSHGVMAIINRNLLETVRLFEYIGLIALLVYTGTVKERLPKPLYIIYRVLLLFVFSLFLYFDILHDTYTFNFSRLMTAAVFLLMWRATVNEVEKGGWMTILALLALLAFSFTPAIGSNTGLLKIAPLLIAFMPYIAEQCNMDTQQQSRIGYIILLGIFAIPLKTISIYEDSPVFRLTQSPKSQLLTHIRTTPIRANFVDDVISVYNGEKRQNQEVMFFGKMAHVFTYLTKQEPLYRASFWMLPDDDIEVERAEHVLKRLRPVVFFLPEYPSDGTKEFKKALFANAVVKHGHPWPKPATVGVSGRQPIYGPASGTIPGSFRDSVWPRR